jgi:hypothetical protein
MSLHVVKDGELNYKAPLTIWVLAAQLFYAILAIMPMYYFWRNIEDLTQTQYQWIIILIPIFCGFILFAAMILLNEIYWYNEKHLLRRDLITSASKSSVFVTVEFYFIYFFVLGWFMSEYNPHYYGPITDVIIEKLALDLLISLGTIILTVISMISIQRYRPTRVK